MNAIMGFLKRSKLSVEKIQQTISNGVRIAHQRAFTAGRIALQRQLDELVTKSPVLFEVPPIRQADISTMWLDISASKAAEKFAASKGSLEAITPDIRRIVATENSRAFNAGVRLLPASTDKMPEPEKVKAILRRFSTLEDPYIVPKRHGPGERGPLNVFARQQVGGDLTQARFTIPGPPGFDPTKDMPTKFDGMLSQIWNATFDNTCPICAAMHGAFSNKTGAFPGGLTPGLVHPNCRCFSSIIVVTR